MVNRSFIFGIQLFFFRLKFIPLILDLLVGKDLFFVQRELWPSDWIQRQEAMCVVCQATGEKTTLKCLHWENVWNKPKRKLKLRPPAPSTFRFRMFALKATNVRITSTSPYRKSQSSNAMRCSVFPSCYGYIIPCKLYSTQNNHCTEYKFSKFEPCSFSHSWDFL